MCKMGSGLLVILFHIPVLQKFLSYIVFQICLIGPNQMRSFKLSQELFLLNQV